MRFLMAGFAPNRVDLGASRIVVGLGTALRGLGHHVEFWFPAVSMGRTWPEIVDAIRAELLRVIQRDGPFDVVDCAPALLSRRIRRLSPFIVARSVQPDLRYISCDLFASVRRSPRVTLATLRYAANAAPRVLCGLQRADRIECLGVSELSWLQRYLKRYAGKAAAYRAALPDIERLALAAIRRNRQRGSMPVRVLWLGRWSPHKGTTALVQYIRRRTEVSRDEVFTIAGCGNAASIPEDIRKHPRVEILPSYDRDGLFALLRSHDVGLFTSRVEGWGLSLMEMLESGMRVFATRAGAVPELEKFFPATLASFPPQQLQADVNQTHADETDWDAYLRRFSWEAEAADYVRRISEPLRGH